ncbi:MAG: aldo/keto reductase [Acidisphaera sp.]|nr:aldo/keto reductase [Acidisphaera sp.]MBV9812449.1 aldo/keto reductase [Acetobacteraceae bacterium]
MGRQFPAPAAPRRTSRRVKQVNLPDGTAVAALGQGTWRLGEGARPAAEEAAALVAGIDRGMTLIDTAEMYGEGGAERVVGRAIAGRRDGVFVVTKVYPQNASRDGIAAACARSLDRLGIAGIDLYLLHWRGGVPLRETVAGFEALRRDGRIRRWGVSNFDVDDLEELYAVEGGERCAVNQVLYNVETRGIEWDLLPWCERHRLPIMAYSPVGQAGRLLRSKALAAVGKRHGATPAQVAIAWTLRRPGVISIPKAATKAHVEENAAAASLALTDDDLTAIDGAHPPPRRKQPLGML